jgi:hypothetical protein
MSEEIVDLNPEDYIDKRGDCPVNDYRDLVKERKKPLPKYELTKDDIRVIKEQKKTAKDMERFRKKEMLLRKHADMFPIDDYTMLLYRLPLTEKQMDEVYNNLTNK